MTTTFDLEELASTGAIHPSWVAVLDPVQTDLKALAEFLTLERNAGEQVLPAEAIIFRAFQIPFESVRVVIVGQDPYPTPGHSVGLAFSIAPETKPFPRSLANIFTELNTDLGLPKPENGDLSHWREQGVMLLNRVLTVRAGVAGSHRGYGWEAVTQCALQALDSRPGKTLVAVLWGNDAQRARDLLSHSLVIESVHPSPLSASRGFFGSKPFSKVNDYLMASGGNPIDFSLD